MSEKLKTESQSPYKVKDTVRGCDKGGHKLRSIANQPNHLKHKTIFRWKPK